MKVKDLVKDGWPTVAAGYSGQEQWMKGWNQCLTVIEPIKEMEVGIDTSELCNYLNIAYHACRSSQSYEENYHVDKAEKTLAKAIALAANLDKILVVEKGKID